MIKESIFLVNAVEMCKNEINKPFPHTQNNNYYVFFKVSER